MQKRCLFAGLCIVVLLFVVGCAKEVSEEELAKELDSLSEEELSYVLSEDEKALAGQASNFSPPQLTKLNSLRKTVKPYKVLCSDSDGGANYKEAGYVTLRNYPGGAINKSDRCWDDGKRLQEYVCEKGKYKGDQTVDCAEVGEGYGCKENACKPTVELESIKVSFTESDLPAGCHLYTSAGSYRVKECDAFRSLTDHYVIAQVRGVGEGGIGIGYLIKTSEGIFNPENQGISMRPEEKGVSNTFGYGFFGINLLLEENSYDSDTNSVVLNHLNSCESVYEKCLLNGGAEVLGLPCSFFCPYDGFPGEIYSEAGDSFAKSLQTTNLEAVESLMRCRALNYQQGLTAWESFGIEYPFPKVAVIQFPGSVEGIVGGFYAIGYAVIDNWPIEPSTSEVVACLNDLALPEYPLFGPNHQAGHEQNHNYLWRTALRGFFNEGLANYMAFKTSGEDDSLICTETGWRAVGEPEEAERPYGEHTLAYQCFWKQLEETYGEEVFRKVLHNIVSSRYINPSTGERDQKYIFRDLINPAVGEDLRPLVLSRYNYTDVLVG